MRLLLLVLLSIPAWAQSADSLARAHYVTGESYYSQGRFGNALTEFQEAYRLSERPAFLYNIAVCHEKLGEIDEAVRYYEQYLGTAHPSDEDRRATVARIEALRPKPALVTPPAPKERPLYKRPWLWGVVAAGAVVVAGAITLGVVLGTRDDTRTLQPLRPQ